MADASHPVLVRLSADDIALFRALDRSETVDGLYRRVAEGLLLTDYREVVSGWPTGLLEKYLPQWGAAAAAGCPFLGARLDGKIMGLAVINPRHRPSVAQLMSLYVDRAARRKGVAALLSRSAFDVAREAGATAIYVSASPTRGSVGFYWSVGFRPAEPAEIDPDLFALEPNDIHMIRSL